jgi:hypothetical protein
MSDMETGAVVAMYADWADNAVPDQFEEARSRAVSIIDALR